MARILILILGLLGVVCASNGPHSRGRSPALQNFATGGSLKNGRAGAVGGFCWTTAPLRNHAAAGPLGRGGAGQGVCGKRAPLVGINFTRGSGAGASLAMSGGGDSPFSEKDRARAMKRKDGGEEKPMLFVGNLPWILDSWGLEKLFEPFGKIVAAKISFDHRTDRSRGYGFIIYERMSSARAALEAMRGKDIGGRRMDVQPAGMAPRSNPGIDANELRVNPSNSDARYSMSAAGPNTASDERQAYQLTVEAMDLIYWEKFSDPYYNVAEDDWAELVIEDNDDTLDWTDYRLNWDYYDPIQKKVIFGRDALEPMRANGPGRKINWDLDWIAEPLQMLPDGSEYHVADPDRPIPENFDEIFAINDERRMKELMDWDGTTSLDDLKIANRATGEERQRRPGDMNNRLNIVDPFGKRTVRRGLRDKASNQMGSIERMHEQESMLKQAGARIEEAGEDGLSAEEKTRMRFYEKQTLESRSDEGEEDGKGPGGKWTVKKAGGDDKPAYSPPKDGYTLMPPGGISGTKAEGKGGMARAAGLGREEGPPQEMKQLRGGKRASKPREEGPPQEELSEQPSGAPPLSASASGVEEVKKSPGRPRKDGTPAQPRSKAEGDAPRRAPRQPKAEPSDDSE